MMAAAGPPSSSSLLPLLESLEDNAAGQSEQTDAYLTIANRLSGDEGRQFLPAVEKHFSRLGKAALAHASSSNAELSQAALQALGFCVYHSHVVSGVPETLVAEILSALCSLVVKSTDKNTCTRALWVISKQSFPPDVVAKKVPSILGTLESVWSREDIQSVVMEHEALNVIIRMLEQVPAQMGDGAVRWAKVIIPLVVHSASKVRLRAAAAMEMGMPLLLQKQAEVAAIIEPMMSSKLIPELQKLFMSKNEANVLKLWPLFVKLLGKLLHRGGPFINSLLHLEELGFRSSSPTIKKIAFIAWKSLIDNFALNPDILCSSKRMKLLMQPLASIHVRTEPLMLTKVEVWWYLVVQLGPNLSSNFDQVSVPLLQCTIGSDSPSVPGTPSRAVGQNGSVTPATPKTTGAPGFSSPANTSRMSLNSSVQVQTTFPSIQLLGLEMLLHYFLGPEVIAAAGKSKIVLSLEPLNHPLLSGASSFTKHAAVLTSNIRDGFISLGKEAPDHVLALIWTNLVRYVNTTIESSSKKDRQGCEVLTLMLQALQSIVTSDALPADKVLILVEETVKGLPQRVLGSASYQVGKMDVLNGTPALFLILLLYNSSMLPAYIEDERFFLSLQTLVGCGLSGHTSPLAFSEAVLGAVRRSSASVQNKEQLWRMWSVMVGPLTETITQSNEVNQGDALEHNFSAMHSALLFPVTHLLQGTPLQQTSQKSMLSTWSKLYKVFARCSALVVTAEENICCEELCAKMTAAIEGDALKVPSTLNAVSSILQVMVDCVDFSPFTPQFVQKLKSPHTPVNWTKKRSEVLGNLTTFQSLLVQCLNVFLEDSDSPSESTGVALVSVMSTLFSNLALANTVTEALKTLIQPLTLLYKQAASEPSRFPTQLQGKLEKLLSDVLGCLQTRSTLAYNDELLALLSPLLCVLFPHKNKQLRTATTQFWNATFANSVSLTYPEEIRPILSQLKQKTPIILPGFEAVSVPDEHSGQYSSESSQMETKLSGMPVSSAGKRDSLLRKAKETKERSTPRTSKPVSTKLDFGTPKLPRSEFLDEEASIDFVFIPPETKERVLTEHQKEVKRTKRVDIPAMYNNLDASLDTTVFTQYTQSQEDSLDKQPLEQAENVNKEPLEKVPEKDAQNEENPDVLMKDTQDFACPKAAENVKENQEQAELIPESADVSMEDASKTDRRAEDVEMLSKEGTSPNVSGSSDLVSGTPQKANSRRQSFITLEKYAERKPASPISVTKFTGPLVKTSNSQEHSKTKISPSQGSLTSTGPNSQESQSSQARKTNSQAPAIDPDSPVRPKDSGTKWEPVRLTDRLPSDTTEDEDVIPDTQTEAEGKKSEKEASAPEEMEISSQEEDSQQSLDDSQSSSTESSPSEPRRSRRQRVLPLLPGEDPEERDRKFLLLKRKRSDGEPQGDSPKSNSSQSRPNTRSKNAAEEDSSRDRLRTRAQREKGESSQTNSQGRAQKKMKLFSNSEDFLDQPEPRRRSTRDRDSSQAESQSESQSQGRSSRRGRSSSEIKEEADVKKKLPGKEESRQAKMRSNSQSEQESQSQGRLGRRSKSSMDIKKDLPEKESSQTATPEPEVVKQAEKDQDKPKEDSELITGDPVTNSKSEEFDLMDQAEKDDSQMITPSLPKESQDRTSLTNEVVNVLDNKEKVEGLDGDLSQEDSSVITPTSLDSQSLRKSRRSKVSPDTGGQSQETNKLAGVSEIKDKTAVGTDNLSQDSQSSRKSKRIKTLSDSQMATSSPQAVGESQESQIVEKVKKEKKDSQKKAANEAQSQTSTSKTLVEDKSKTTEDANKDSQVLSSSSESQSQRKSRRSKALSDSPADGQSQESQIVEKTTKGKRDSQAEAVNESQVKANKSNKMLNESVVEDINKDSQALTSSSDSQSSQKSRRSKALPDSQSVGGSPQTEGESQSKKEKKVSQDETSVSDILVDKPDVETKTQLADVIKDSQELAPSSDSQSLRTSRRSKVLPDSQPVAASPQSDAESQSKKEKKGLQDGTSVADIVVDKPDVKTNTQSTEVNKDSQELAPSSDNQSLRKSRRSKVLPDSQTDGESQSRKENKDSKNESQGGTSGSKTLVNKPHVETISKTEGSQKDTQDLASSDSQSLRKSRRSKTSDSQSFAAASPQKAGESQTNKEKGNSEKEATESQDKTSEINKLVNKKNVEDTTKTTVAIQEDSQVLAMPSSDSQPLRKSRKSKALSEAAESEDKATNKDSSRRQSRSSSQTLGAVDQGDTKTSGRTRRSIAKEDSSKSSPSSILEGSQSLDTTESSQGRGRSSRRSSQALVDSSGSESSEAKEASKKREKKPRVSLQNPPTLESEGVNINQDVVMNDSLPSQNQDSQTFEEKSSGSSEDLPKESQGSESQKVSSNIEEENKELPMEVEDNSEIEDMKNSEIIESPSKEEQGQMDTEATAPQETRDLEPAEVSDAVQISPEPTVEQHFELPSEMVMPPDQSAEQLQVSESSKKRAELFEPEDEVSEDESDDLASNNQEQPLVLAQVSPEDEHSPSRVQKDIPDLEKEQPSAAEGITPSQETDKDTDTQLIDQEGEEDLLTANTESKMAANEDPTLTNVFSTLSSESTNNQESVEKLQGSPAKQKDLEALMGQDVGQSPSGGRTRGSWSPSASPSTSILKKAQKRPLEDETPSPLVKSRRVSFANPIQQQEMADDIDRRSPALRTSSPRRSKGSSIPQSKYITTPTKGMLVLSPRNLHSPGYKSSKKCLISEMSQEPRPVSRDCIYPALVGCSTPVEAVLPQISSNMWSRGFGQLVRARNIKTVGDLSALTPSEIKTLPIRSPKISNVKKALRIYEQQRKGRGGDDLKSFDETEMMTSELEDANAPQNHEEEDKTQAETLATELLDEALLSADMKPELNVSTIQTTESPPGEQTPADQLQSEGLLSGVEALSGRMTPQELGQCSAQQLVQMHDHLGGMMRQVVVELQTRLCKTSEKP